MAATTNWLLSTKAGTPGMNLPSNNKAGFSGLPGGERYEDDGAFRLIGEYGYWWTSTKESQANSAYAYNRYISNDAGDLAGFQFGVKMANMNIKRKIIFRFKKSKSISYAKDN